MQKLQMKKCFVQSGRYKINHEWKCQKKKKEIPSQQYSCSYCVYKAQYPLAYYIPVKRKV